MNKPRIVVLGGTGFVGSRLVSALARAGWRVTVASRNAMHKPALGAIPEVRVVSVDPLDSAALARLLDGAAAAVNLIGILNERGFSGAGFQRAHVDIPTALIAACRQAGVSRLVQMSALNAGRGKSHYLRTRGEGEQVVKGSGLDWTIFQPSVIFGPGDGLYCRFAGLLDLAPVLPLAKPGAKFAPVYVGDVAAAFLRALDDPDSSCGQVYELYGPQVFTLREIVAWTAQQRSQRRCILPLPDTLGRLQAMLMDFIPGKPFSSDNWKSLQVDSVGGIDGLYRLGIAKTPVARIMRPLLAGIGKQSRLDRYRAGG